MWIVQRKPIPDAFCECFQNLACCLTYQVDGYSDNRGGAIVRAYMERLVMKLNRLAFALLLSFAGNVAHAAQDTADTVLQAKRTTALEVANLLNDASFRQSLADAFEYSPPSRGGGLRGVPLRPVLRGFSATGPAHAGRLALESVELDALRAKGTALQSQGLFEVRLHVPKGHDRPARLDDLSVAFTPAGDESSWTTIEAFDRKGNKHTFDAGKPLPEPMLVVDLDGREDMRSGIEVVNRFLADHGLQPPNAMVNLQADRAAGQLTVLDKIRLKNTEEPPISGDADIYAIESGINTDGTKPLVVIHDMPWLDRADITYTPGQHVISWNNHNAIGYANLILMEQDDATDWNAKARALLTAVTVAVGPVQPKAAVVSAIGAAILKALPDDALTNTDDYVDSFYLLEPGKTYVDRVGARSNATATFVPR